MWYGRSDNESQCPITCTETGPDHTTFARENRRSLEDVLDDIDVGHLDSNVTVEGSSDDAGDDVQHVARLKRSASSHTLERNTEHVLSRVGVKEVGVEAVRKIDDQLSDDHALPKVHRTSHFGHELWKDHRSAVGEDHVHDTVHLRREWQRRRDFGVDGSERTRRVVGSVDGILVETLGSDNAHADKDDGQVHPHCQIGQDRQAAQSSDLRQNHSNQRPDHDADAEAEVSATGLDQLAERLTVGEANETDVDLETSTRSKVSHLSFWVRIRKQKETHNKLDGLKQGDDVASPLSEQAFGQITVGLDGEPS